MGIGRVSPHVVGMGRVCIDHYLAHQASADRFDGSAKRSCGELHMAVGGSVPRILAAASATNAVSCHFIGGARQADIAWIQGELDQLSVSTLLFDAESTARSFIEFDADRSLVSITSIETSWTLSIPPGVFDERGQRPAVLLTDGRQSSQLLAIMERLDGMGGPTPALWLDPGTTWNSNVEPARCSQLSTLKLSSHRLTSSLLWKLQTWRPRMMQFMLKRDEMGAWLGPLHVDGSRSLQHRLSFSEAVWALGTSSGAMF